jgi:hypothetical protein
MSLPKPITIANEADLIKAQLETYAKPRGGTVKVLANMRHLWEEIFLLTDAPRILICYTGETARGEYAGGTRTALHRVDRSWQVVVMRGHGFNNLLPGGEVAGKEDFYDSVETVRDGCRVLQTISEEFPVNYKSIRPLPSAAPTAVANVFMDAFVIEFDTANDIPIINADGTAT